MAGMQRFVTYLYSYRKNEKLANIGFAKIEIRGGQCRLEIHLKGALAQGTSSPVYLFAREEEKLPAVEIGKISGGAGGSDFRAVLPGGKISGSGYDIYDVKGIYIPVDEELMFASQWDDGEIARERFFVWQPPEEEAETPGEETGQKEAAPVLQERTAPPVMNLMKEVIGAATYVANTTAPKEPELSAADMAEDRETPEAETPEAEAAADPAGEAWKDIQATELLRSGQPSGEKPLREMLLESFLKLQRQHQTVEIFETGRRQISGIRIELRDLRELPRQFWNLGNNSFLLHGFFNYQYLLLGKRIENEAETIFVGVPGVFHNQERLMASLFGFTEFLPENRIDQRQKSGFGGTLQEIDSQEQLLETLRAAEVKKTEDVRQFGYWCHSISC